MEANNILITENINKSFKSGSMKIDALKNVSIKIPEKKLTVLKGPSGSGKTTLMNIIGALDLPDSGSVYFNNKNLTLLSEKQRETLRRTKIGFVFQSVALVSIMTAFENVEFGLRLSNYPIKQRVDRATECLTLVGLEKRANHRVHELSGGEQQRVGIARAIAHKPEIIFADEPTAELDSHSSLVVIKLFKTLIKEQGLTVVMTTHDPEVIEVADNVYNLVDGGIVNE